MVDKISLKRILLFAVSVILLIFLDQLTKYLAVIYLKDNGSVVLIDGILELLYVENRGAAFGIMYGMGWLFVVLALLVSAAVIYIYVKMPRERKFLPLEVCMACIVAGAMGNIIDRIRNGFVVDFIYFSLIDFPVFNVADIYVTCSAIALIVLFLFIYKEDDINKIPLLGKKQG